ncbi:MAG: hypothetical protein CMM01_25545 [Rhodopirellula sp.]|nr:hypothetical protein [Rhodopirellula sp.]
MTRSRILNGPIRHLAWRQVHSEDILRPLLVLCSRNLDWWQGMDFRNLYRQVCMGIAWKYELVTVETEKKRRKYSGPLAASRGGFLSQ